MLEKFTQHIAAEFPFLTGKKLLVAISGGIDSVVLSHLLHTLGFDIALAHCNFKLRGEESDQDEAFVGQLAEKFSCPFYRIDFDTEAYAKTHKLSIQLAARRLRYQWFLKLLQQEDYAHVLTAHNTNDNLETFLINLTRSSGLEGFTGIPPIHGAIARPLLAFSRDDIMLYAIKHAIVWREDRSNASVKYIRNKVRHKIVPILAEINPYVLASFKNTISHLNESQLLVEEAVQTLSEKIISSEPNAVFKINITKLKKINHIEAYLYELLKEYGFTEWNDIMHLVDAQTGKQVFSKTYRLLKDRHHLILAKINTDVLAQTRYTVEEGTATISKPIALQLEETTELNTQNNYTLYLDKDLLKFPLTIRKWVYGDYFYPTGMQGSKKLSQFYKDRKLSLLEKENIWLLTNADDDIIWVIGRRGDRRFTATPETKHILKLRLV